jgi:hypothetical protein
MSPALTSCESGPPWPELSIRNDTSIPIGVKLLIFPKGEARQIEIGQKTTKCCDIYNVPPKSTQLWGDFLYLRSRDDREFLILAADSHATVLFAQVFSVADFERADWVVTVTDERAGPS